MKSGLCVSNTLPDILQCDTILEIVMRFLKVQEYPETSRPSVPLAPFLCSQSAK